jgi:hypothetical protein
MEAAAVQLFELTEYASTEFGSMVTPPTAYRRPSAPVAAPKVPRGYGSGATADHVLVALE